MRDIILASKSKVRKDILSTNGIHCRVIPSNVDEDSVKISLTRDKALPEIISKNLAELKANKVSAKFPNELVIGADSVIDLNGKVMSKPNNRNEATELFMKKFTLIELEDYLSKINDEALYAYNVYQIEGLGKTLFSEIKGDNDTIMGLPVKKIKEYLKNFN
jgi:septum formation protein